MYIILNTTKLVEIYIACDDFAKKFEQYQISKGQDIPKEKMSYSEIGKSSMGWFFGFKLHTVINQLGQLVVFEITTGKVADSNSELLKGVTAHLSCFLYGDKDYITALREEFAQRNLHLITKLRANMKKNQILIEQQTYYSRHRNPKNFLINLLAGLIAYIFGENTKYKSISTKVRG